MTPDLVRPETPRALSVAGATPRLPAVRRAASGAAALGLAISLALGGCAMFSDDAKDPDKGASAEKLYEDARSELSAGGWDRAAKLLERVEARGTGTLLGQQATLDLAYAQWRGGERAQALTTVDRFIRLHPSSPAFDYALYLRGLINFNDNLGLFGRWSGQDLAERDQRASREAYQAFEQLVQQYPQSKYAADARQRMAYIVNSLAGNEVAVARYYYNRGAWLAAANRAQKAVTEFQHSPRSREALQIMVDSYDRLGLTDLRDDARRVLAANFPEAPARPDAPTADKRPWWRFW